MAAPVLTVTTDKTDYQQGETVTAFHSVPGDMRDDPRRRVLISEGEDDETPPNRVSVRTEIVTHVMVPDGFTLTRVWWEDTGVDASVVGMVATTVA